MLNPYQKTHLKVRTGSPDDEKLQEAKQFPIQDLYTGKLTKTGKVMMGVCPFHDDSSPSFAIYPETNTYYCFSGCGGGDVVSFYMKLKSCDFKTALEDLT